MLSVKRALMIAHFPKESRNRAERKKYEKASIYKRLDHLSTLKIHHLQSKGCVGGYIHPIPHPQTPIPPLHSCGEGSAAI